MAVELDAYLAPGMMLIGNSWHNRRHHVRDSKHLARIWRDQIGGREPLDLNAGYGIAVALFSLARGWLSSIAEPSPNARLMLITVHIASSAPTLTAPCPFWDSGCKLHNAPRVLRLPHG